MKTDSSLILIGAAAAALCACQPSEDWRGPRGTAYAGEDSPRSGPGQVEVYAEHPVLAFQRTGQQPVPVAVLPADTPLVVKARSGSFCEVGWNGGSGWVAAEKLVGLPDPAPLSEGESPATGGPSGGAPGREDKIDLDRMP
jgi:hypothetical protein